MLRTHWTRRRDNHRIIDLTLYDEDVAFNPIFQNRDPAVGLPPSNGGVIGRCTLVQFTNRPHMARMYNVWIHEHYRNQHIAGHWLALIMDWAYVELGVDVIRGKVQRNNGAAVSLYQRLGFHFSFFNERKMKISMRLNDAAKNQTAHMERLLRNVVTYNRHQNQHANHPRPFRPIFSTQFQRATEQLDRQHEEEQEQLRLAQDNNIDVGSVAHRWYRFDENDVIHDDMPPEINEQRPRRTVNLQSPSVLWNPPTIDVTQFVSMSNNRSANQVKKEAPKPKPKEPRKPDMFDELPFYEKFKLPGTPHAMLSALGVGELMKWMSKTLGIEMSHTEINDFVGLESMIKDHEFTYGHDDYDAGGKFISRLAKVLAVTRRYKLSDFEKTEIGNLIDEYWVGGDGDYYFDLCNTIDWESGAFGEKSAAEGGSCWWLGGGLSHSRSRVRVFASAMPEQAIGLRLWTLTNGDYIGVGRVWVLRTQLGYPTLFNSYGFNSPLTWAAKLSKYLKFKNYSRVGLAVGDYEGRCDFPVNGRCGVIMGYPDDYIPTSFTFMIGDENARRRF